eukprot:CAMPEP_0174310250 /NCGR_PEP_ID=MMETSP0810-20121108/2932_1 /TAXON_ID=73025 ORGANISM="Eutreptiella gymnastica-like, Strain CCMP1594" /NCGR_SAMPLE_ID=MMETSP0810 /ASSEMBLY_ACC=CAM_ASM_000659 /LENGTH=73 /DNA_ID=CAMNT_0015418115 /DNA_START=937 /DNA_END=1158 /DNA_ORIENTATION=-
MGYQVGCNGKESSREEQVHRYLQGSSQQEAGSFQPPFRLVHSWHSEGASVDRQAHELVRTETTPGVAGLGAHS